MAAVALEMSELETGTAVGSLLRSNVKCINLELRNDWCLEIETKEMLLDMGNHRTTRENVAEFRRKEN